MHYGPFTRELLINVINIYNDNTFVGSQISTKLKLGKPPFKKDKHKEHIYLQLALFQRWLYRAVTQGTQAQALEVEINKTLETVAAEFSMLLSNGIQKDYQEDYYSL